MNPEAPHKQASKNSKIEAYIFFAIALLYFGVLCFMQLR